jgi:hypothetical protein
MPVDGASLVLGLAFARSFAFSVHSEAGYEKLDKRTSVAIFDSSEGGRGCMKQFNISQSRSKIANKTKLQL